MIVLLTALAAASTLDAVAAVPLPLNHDLFDGTAAPLFRMREITAIDAPIPLAFDARAAPDVVLLKCNDAPAAPPAVEIAVGRAARTVYILTAAQGPLDVRDIAADGEIRYANGRIQALKWMVGEQAWPAWAGASGRNADPVALGVNVAGDVLTASLMTVDVSWPDVPIDSIEVRSRPGALSVAILAVTTSSGPPATVQAIADRRPGAWFDFRVRDFPDVTEVAPVRRVSVRDGHLAFPDGSRARFWGVNLVSLAALPRPELAGAEARHLARAGFNLVRPHHMDVAAEGSLLNPKRGEPGEPVALPEALDRMDRFFAALKGEGIHSYLETWTLRSFAPAEGLPAPQGIPVGNKYVSFIWPEYAEAKKAWVRAVYGRVNPYTGLRYADDPAVALFEISNEDSLLVGWSGGSLEKLPGAHRQRLDELWNAWLRLTYATDAKLNAAWAGRMRAGLQMGETLSLDSVAREPATRGRTELYPTARAADLVRFYGELEAAHYADMATFLRGEMGFSAPLVCNTSFGIPLADALLAACDVIDLHVYWDPASETNVFFDHSAIERPIHGRLLEDLAWCQERKPCTISELNHSWPNRYGQEAPLFWAALASRQDIDAVMWFAWGHHAFDPEIDGPLGSLDLQGRWTTLAQLPTAAALFRSGSIEPPARRFVRWWSADGLLRDLAEPQGLWLDPQVSWSAILDDVVRTSFDARPPAMAAAPSPAEGLIRWSPERFVIDTPRVAAILGRGGEVGGRLRADVETFAAISLISLGDRALLTVAGRTDRDGTLRSTGGPGLLVLGKGPARLERLRGTVAVRWKGRPRAVELDEHGKPGRVVKTTRTADGMWSIRLEDLGSPWVMLE